MFCLITCSWGLLTMLLHKSVLTERMQLNSQKTACSCLHLFNFGEKTSFVGYSWSRLGGCRARLMLKFVWFLTSWTQFVPIPDWSCTGCSVRTIQLVDLNPYSSFSIASPPRVEELSLPQLMHRKSQSVFGRVDFFSTLRYLVVSLRGRLELGWVLLSPELSKVRSV